MSGQAAGGLTIAPQLREFFAGEALPGTGVSEAQFWDGLGRIVATFAPRNKALLDKRDALQQKVDAWHHAHRGKEIDRDEYMQFLNDIGYLLPAPAKFAVTTGNVDPEISSIAGPQLVVPVSNARYALNAANARWGSLYDALYGTDAIPDEGDAKRGRGYNPARGALVVARARRF